MAKNRKLFEEAIADAKAVKSMAIENARKALQESITPHLQSMLSEKIKALEEDENVSENEETEEVNEVEETNVVNETEEVEEAKEEIEESDELNLDELLAELNEDEEINETEEVNENLELDEKKDETEEVEAEEEIDLDDMSADDLKNFIEGVIKDMVTAGELEADHKGPKGPKAGPKEPKGGKNKAPKAEKSDDEEVSIDEILANLEENEAEVNEEKDETNEELEVALETIDTLRSEINEVNLLNAKLLYVNKIFKANNLNENVKKNVLSSFDKAKTVQEVKIVYNTLLESIEKKITKKTNITENLGSASRVIKNTKTQPILETNDTFARWKKLAGLK